MRNPKILLALILSVVVMAAWADDNAVVNKPKSDKDNQTVVAPVQPANANQQPDQAAPSSPRQDQAPASRDGAVQAPDHRSDNAQPPQSEHNAVQAPESRSGDVQAPNSSQSQESRVVTEPAPSVRTEQNVQSYRGSSGSGDINIPQTGGNPRQQGGGGTHGGYSGGGGNWHGRSPEYYGGLGWHGQHEEWRYRHYHGDWGFLFDFGPVIYYPSIHYPYVIRLPHDRVGVYVRYTGEDHVGTQFADAVRQHLSDAGMRIVYSQDDAQLELYIISMEEDPGDAGYSSAISISYIWYPGHKFITAQMVDAGLNEVDDLAQSVAGYTSDLIDQYR